MKTTDLQTISIFSKDLSLSLTINQISKKLSKSYAFTNQHIRELLEEGILQKKVVGSAILCSLNFSNEKTLGLLMLNSIEEKQTFLKKSDKRTLEAINTMRKNKGIKSIFIQKDSVCVICEDKQIIQKIEKPQGGFRIIDENDFKLGIRSLNLNEIIIIEGYESFWRLIFEMKS